MYHTEHVVNVYEMFIQNNAHILWLGKYLLLDWIDVLVYLNKLHCVSF